MSSKMADALLKINTRLDELDNMEDHETLQSEPVMVSIILKNMPLTPGNRLDMLHKLCMIHLNKSAAVE